MHRVAFEIEEKIARIGQWQLVETKPGLMGYNFESAQPGFDALLLQTRLLSQSNQSIRRNAGDPATLEFGKHGSSRHAGLDRDAGFASL